MSDFKGCQSNEEGLVIATGEEVEEGEKVTLKILPSRGIEPGPAA